jgi:hypothetical protein
MANLRANNVCGTDGRNAITGSVEFDGTGDYLSIVNGNDFAFGTGDFTIEGFFYFSSNSNFHGLSDISGGSTGYWLWNIYSGTMYWQNARNSSNLMSSTLSNYQNSWSHFAVSRYNQTTRMFRDGIQIASAADTTNYNGTGGNLNIGAESANPLYSTGFISNFRIIKGTALYTSNFIPPTRKLIRLPGTVLLCCQDNNSVTTEATGKTITANGNPAARRFVPQVGSDGGLVFDGTTKVNTQNYFYLATGITEQRSRGRGVFGGGYNPGGSTNAIDFINIQSLGNSISFGALSSNMGDASGKAPAAASSSTRALFASGYSAPGPVNTIEYVTISTQSNTTDFGDLSQSRRDLSGCSSSLLVVEQQLEVLLLQIQ